MFFSSLFEQIFWNQTGELVCIATEESFYTLRYTAQAIAAAATNKDLVSDDGIEDAFDVKKKHFSISIISFVCNSSGSQ